MRGFISERISVRDFGARADFVSDDTASIQAAIDTCRALGRAPGGKRAVYLPGGDYLVGPLTTYHNVTLAGDGTGNTRIFSRDPGQTTLQIAGITENAASVHVRGLSFFANGQAGTGLHFAGSGADMRVIDVRVEDCQFSLFERAVVLRLCNNVWLEQVHAAACGTGFLIDTSSDVKANHCFCDSGDGWGFLVSDDGAHGACGEGVYLMGCTTNNQTGGLRVVGQHWGHAVGCSFTTCRGDAVVLDGATCWRIAQGEVASTTDEGRGIVLAPGSAKCIVEGNYIALNNGGLLVGGTDHIVANNLLDAGIGAAPDIALAGLACKINGNKCLSTANPHSILEVGDGNFNYIVGNMVQGRIVKAGAGTAVSAEQFYY